MLTLAGAALAVVLELLEALAAALVVVSQLEVAQLARGAAA